MCTKGWSGGGHADVPATSYVICCYAAEISGVVATVSKSDLIVSKSQFPNHSFRIRCYSFQIKCHSFQIIVSESAVLSLRI